MELRSDSDLDMDNRVFTDGEALVLMVTTIVDELYVTKYFYRFARASTGPDRGGPLPHLPGRQA